MLVQRCALKQHRLIVPVSVTPPLFDSGQFRQSFNSSQYRALVDTGAQRSVLARSVIAEQKLMRVGHMQFAGIHGPRTHSRYLADIAMWATRVETDRRSYRFDNTEQTLFTLPEPVEVVDMDDNSNFEMILGFDILRRFSFSYTAGEQAFEICIQP